MLNIEIADREFFDEAKSEFIKLKGMTISLEHSLVSLAKWESKWKKPFLSSEKTSAESIDYIRCMTITKNVPDYIYSTLTEEQIKEISAYISDPMTATTFTKNENERHSREIITAEIIYYWMFSQQIPYECRQWHLNNLLALIKVSAIKSGPQKKMNKRDVLSRNAALNAARKARLGTSG